ncbi:hypothetical protein RDI58_024634 [Solanum bulbocastanum]|uniref:Uncharacterized protein n=1 Tax=Solanum bulbocastanum TaxID=147425 RepID=A0AAN8T3M2_SOLBU
MGTKTKNKLVKYIGAPFKVLGKAREFYMKTMFDCAQQVGQGGSVMSCTVSHRKPQQLPKSTELKKQSTWRSYSTGVGRLGRIDENKPCDFNESDVHNVVYPRSRSHSIVNRGPRSRI